MWYIDDSIGKRRIRTTGYSKDDYTKKQVQSKINSLSGTKRTVKHSIEWLEEYTSCTLEIEGVSEKTIKLYKLSFNHLKAVYGRNYPIHKIGRSAVRVFQSHLRENGTGNAGINSYLRTLRAAFERLVMDEKIEIK